MTERPILFSAPMVRALLAGTKTQTRRTVKPQPDFMPDHGYRVGDALCCNGKPVMCPYGHPGNRLWVRESTAEDCIGSASFARYAADGFTSRLAWWYSKKACPSIHMPRWASRILLEIVDVRVERLQEISERDAEAEGCLPMFPDDVRGASYVYAYSRLWESINGPGSWDANPWVWCLTFKRV